MSAAGLDTFLFVGSMMCVGGFAILVLRGRPKAMVALFLLSLPLVPPWIGTSVGPLFVSLHTATALVTIFMLWESSGPRPLWNTVDSLVAIVTFLITGAALMGLVPLASPYTFVSQWVMAYAAGRAIMTRFGWRFISLVITIGFGTAAALALTEFLTGLNVFLQFMRVPNFLYGEWQMQQSRGDVLRAEGAFGHSIALGCSLSIALIFTLTSWLSRRAKALLSLLFVAGIVVTFSRTALVTVGLGSVLLIMFGRIRLGMAERLLALGGMIASYFMVIRLWSGIFADEGSTAVNSAAYRLWILDLLPTIRPLGVSAAFYRSGTGDVSFGSYKSIDSAVLYFALLNGWLALGALLLLLAFGVVRLFRGSTPPALIAVLSQMPAFLTVALINQYSMVLWLAVGVAVSHLTIMTPRSSTTGVSIPLDTRPNDTAPRRALT